MASGYRKNPAHWLGSGFRESRHRSHAGSRFNGSAAFAGPGSAFAIASGRHPAGPLTGKRGAR